MTAGTVPIVIIIVACYTAYEVMKMARMPREYGESGYYHVILRGVNKSEIFLDEEDNLRFLSTLRRYMTQLDTLVIAYCLMGNHVHLLLKANEDGLGLFMKCVEVSYVSYFNKKYSRTGHLFEARFKCKPVDDDEYLFTVLRYILMNPETAGMADHKKYRWSNYREFIKDGGWTDAKSIYKDLIDGEEEFLAIMSDENEIDQHEAELAPVKNINQVAANIEKILGPVTQDELRKMTKEERIAYLTKLKANGLSIRQIAEITGLNRGSVYNTLKQL